jgi:serine/threonine protein kinase
MLFYSRYDCFWQVVYTRDPRWNVATRSVLLKAADYLALIDPYSKLTELKASQFAYYTVGEMSGVASVMLPSNHIFSGGNDEKLVVVPCLSNAVVVYEALGQGAFAAVYGAFDKVGEAVVAVKVLTVQLPSTLTSRDVDRELLALRGLSLVYSPGLLAVFRIEHPGHGQHVVVMEKMHTKLKQVLKTVKTRLDDDTCQRYITMLCQAVYAMHASHWYHRDIKPANVMVSSDLQTLKLGDFGLTEHGHIARAYAGSLKYLAPEMQDKKKVMGADLEKADLWSLGVVCYLVAHGGRWRHEDLTREKLEARLSFAAVDSSEFVVTCLKSLLCWNWEERKLPANIAYGNDSFHEPGTVLKCKHFPSGPTERPATAAQETPNGPIEHLRYQSFRLMVYFLFWLD